MRKSIKHEKADGYEKIEYGGEILAIILRKDFSPQQTIFLSPPEFSQQLGIIRYPKGGIIKAHIHKRVMKKVKMTQEVLFIKKGRVILNIYNRSREFLLSVEVSEGDVVFLAGGGHGFKMLEDTEMIEVKQGPYSGKSKDKIVFDGVEDEKEKGDI